MRILVLGAGALGGVITARLTAAKVPVVALDNNRLHAAACRDPGITVELPDGTSQLVPIDVVTDLTSLTGAFDFALITLKAPALEEVLSPLVAEGRANMVGTFVSLGNGLVQELIADIVGARRLLVGTVSWAATILGPGHVRQTTLAPFALGDPTGRSLAAELGQLVKVLRNVGPAHATDRIEGQVWSKLLLNSSMSGLGTVGGSVYRDVANHPVGRRLVLDVWTEGYQVARAAGVDLDEVAGVAPESMVVGATNGYEKAGAVLDELMSRIGATKASMWQDLERGVRTEIGVINGGVARVGRQTRVATPLNDRIVEMVKGCELGRMQPSADNFRAFADLMPERV